METINKILIAKQKNHAFRKDIYLLGTDKKGIKYWLEEPTWDCGWYWGFGYVKTYKNNENPQISKNIDSHQHISGFIGDQEIYDFEKKVHKKEEYIHNIFDNPLFTRLTFTQDEGWTLTELFNTAYSLKEAAEIFGRGGSHTTTNPAKKILTDKKMVKKINEVMLPEVFKQIIKILTP